MDITGLVSFFTELAFPVAVAVYFMVFTMRQLERMRTNQIKLQVLMALLLDALDISIPDSEVEEAVKRIKDRRQK